MEQLSCDCVLCNTLKVPCIQLPVHGSKLEVAALLEAPLAVFQVVAIMEPAVADVSRIANFTAQHGAAPMQSILGFGLLGELDGSRLDEQNQRQKVRERGKSEDQNVAAVNFYCFFHSLSVFCGDHFVFLRNVMFRINQVAVTYSDVKLSDPTVKTAG